MADLDALKKEIEDKRDALNDGEDLTSFLVPSYDDGRKPGIKNRRVLKGHFAKIYAMHWCESTDDTYGKQVRCRCKSAGGTTLL